MKTNIMSSLQHMMRSIRLNNISSPQNQPQEEKLTPYLQTKMSMIRVSSHVQFAICDVPIQHVPLLSSDIPRHKANHVPIIMAKK